MSEDRSDDSRTAARKAREARLAAALRANLRRRKAGGDMPRGPAPDLPERTLPATPGGAGPDADDDRK
jgi:hypothetical protein